MAVCVPQRVSGHGTYVCSDAFRSPGSVSSSGHGKEKATVSYGKKNTQVKLLTPYLAFRGVALAEVSAWIGAWIMLMITYWIYQERTDSFR